MSLNSLIINEIEQERASKAAEEAGDYVEQGLTDK